MGNPTNFSEFPKGVLVIDARGPRVEGYMFSAAGFPPMLEKLRNSLLSLSPYFSRTL
jgi:hypothetical protein